MADADLERQKRQAAQARMEYEMPTLQRAFAEAERLLREQRLQVRARYVEMHSELIRREQTLEIIRGYFLETIANGEVATRELEFKQEEKPTLGERMLRSVGFTRL